VPDDLNQGEQPERIFMASMDEKARTLSKDKSASFAAFRLASAILSPTAPSDAHNTFHPIVMYLGIL
jgi:hypothetical protein